MARVTIKDIARQLHINPSTVSRALRGHPDVSGPMKESVKQLAEKLGYKPNFMAINLRRGRTHTIGLIIPEIAPFFFPSLIKAIEEATHEKGYNLLILHSNDQIDREIENAEICMNMGVDGVLVSLSRQSQDIEHFQELQSGGTPIVFLDKVITNSNSHKVVMPGEAATGMAISRLLADLPVARNITGFFAAPRLSITEDRILGFRKALQEHGVPEHGINFETADNPGQAQQKMLDLWNSPQKPEAVFAMSDELLSGIVQAVYQLGIKIPDDLYLVSISDGWLPQFLPFPLPYVKTSGYELGKASAALLFKLIMKLPILPQTHYIDVRMESNRP
ncbi:LacI family DNA-binding transcriptional regulator [Flavihumibacter profundi]|uniref:LacI family DNA-binding transcriptional regulator n=1 Tax=Flavihumibacter profundi TaxID=2716883 RepID=UPI001CC600E5|nr:LacI family DNA-binding transcriptional regulator [Flavihumibacter profundi]MBZ5858127.1 LacI family transcriptional regulator [Flavihumibacter profundi]